MLSNVTFWFILEFIILTAIFIPTVVSFWTGAPWVPTPDARVRKMLELGKIKKGQRVYDLGCGDGRFVHLAAKEYGADAVGLELSPLVYAWARIRNFFLNSSSRIWLRDFRTVPLKDADVLTCYLLPNAMKALRAKLERELKPGARVVSYAFQMEGWEPTYTEPRNPERNFGRIFVYDIPQSMKPKGT